jgi:hypothetical protein
LMCDRAFLYVVPLLIFSTPMRPAAFCFSIPREPTLLGARFCVQGTALGQAGCFVATDGLILTIQP